MFDYWWKFVSSTEFRPIQRHLAAREYPLRYTCAMRRIIHAYRNGYSAILARNSVTQPHYYRARLSQSETPE